MIKPILCVLIATFACINTFAGGCHIKSVSPAKENASSYVAGLLRERVLEIEKEMATRGEELSVVLVARSGQDLSQFDVLEDNPEISLQEHLINTVIEARQEGANLAKKAGRKYTTIKPIIPDHLISNQKLKYSHFGFYVKKASKRVQEKRRNIGEQPPPDWTYIAHLLAECDRASNRYGDSDILTETFDKFFWDSNLLKSDVQKNSVFVLVPSPKIQKNLARLINEPEIGYCSLHEPKYNVASTPYVLQSYKDKIAQRELPSIFQLDDQNSNQWPLELLAAASLNYGEIADRTSAQNLLLRSNYRPSLLMPNGLKDKKVCGLIKGPLWDASNLLNCKNQAFYDYNIFQLITVKSIEEYMLRTNLVAKNRLGQPYIFEITPDEQELKNIEQEANSAIKTLKKIKVINTDTKNDQLNKDDENLVNRDKSVICK